MAKQFNEMSRVQFPAIIHLMKLGYSFISRNYVEKNKDNENNIILPVLEKQFFKLNPKATPKDFSNEYKDIQVELTNNDLGKEFFNRLHNKGNSNFRFIDWDNWSNNILQVSYEIPCKNGEDEFRPDATIFVNGFPLAYIEFKKPNAIRDGKTGMQSEFERMTQRFQNKKFKVFHNITQIIGFTDNMDYSDDFGSHTTGSYYCTSSYSKAFFNSMHEERIEELLKEIHTVSEDDIEMVLKDANKISIKDTNEFKTNCDLNTPANSFLTSLFSMYRFKFFLRFGIAYDQTRNDNEIISVQKQIMRYPQYFATRAIEEAINNGIKKGVIWHTQGSGKTALAFYNIEYLKSVLQEKNIIPQFYFIVDRIDLADQAEVAFSNRGLKVKRINSKRELNHPFMQDVAVVNIQKINEETDLTDNSGYESLNKQNIYFIDEAHRSYNAKGSYLPNLYNADKNSIKIALTGTPLINIDQHGKKESKKTTREIFGDYLNKYYYDQSIQDGFTLRLMREEVTTEYKRKFRNIVDNLQEEIKKGELKKKDILAHPSYCSPLLDYILNDFKQSREIYDDKSIGGMIVADSSEQAREIYRLFRERQSHKLTNLTASLILSNEDDKDTRNAEVKAFKEGKTDFLIVYNMLLTGFNAPRLKKLYLGRVIKAHNLLQALTRVNRPYRNFRVGYIVDFANITKEFDKTNKAYFEELNHEYENSGEDFKNIYGSLFVPVEDIEKNLQKAELVLAEYDTNNLENFANQINDVPDRKILIDLAKTLRELKEDYNIARLLSYDDLIQKIKAKDVCKLLNTVQDRIRTINLIQEASLDSGKDILNHVMSNWTFEFEKGDSEELKLVADDYRKEEESARQIINRNWDQKDPEWVNLFTEFRRIMKKQHINEITVEETRENTARIKEIIVKMNNLNAKNERLAQAFGGDTKYARSFKKVTYDTTGKMVDSIRDNPHIYFVMKNSKDKLDEEVAKNSGILTNEPFFDRTVIQALLLNNKNLETKVGMPEIKEISSLLTREYHDEYEGIN